MPNTKINEAAVTGGNPDYQVTVPVDVLEDDGTTAKVRIEGCGIHVRQGHIHNVPSTAIHR
ncbi:hypothetical protein [Streptomyces pseudovenezuelae]|uniref:hypothetical protein n=1 Tax=Streptomyces pseudovenezuelae TaxID=67350 RepID=UPI0036E0E7DE